MNPSDNSGTEELEQTRRLHHALTADRQELMTLVGDPSSQVLRNLLKNPNLDETHLAALLKRSNLPEDLLAAVARHLLVEPSHALKVALAHHPDTPAHVVQTLLPQLHLFELVSICFLPGVVPDQKVAAERAIIQRLPVTPLGSKITLARRATPAVLDAMLQEGNSRLLEACLDNPRLKESSLFRFLNGPSATAETISAIARHQVWKNRPNLRLAILRNSRTPPVWFTVMLPELPLAEVRNLRMAGRLSGSQRACVEEELKRRGK